MSEFCPSHEDETTDESAEFYRLKSRCFVVKTTQTLVLHINISVRQWYLQCREIALHCPESQVVARSAQEKCNIPVGIVMHNRVCFMELSKLERFMDAIGVAIPPSVTKVSSNLCKKYWFGWIRFSAMVVDPNRQCLKLIRYINLPDG